MSEAVQVALAALAVLVALAYVVRRGVRALRGRRGGCCERSGRPACPATSTSGGISAELRAAAARAVRRNGAS